MNISSKRGFVVLVLVVALLVATGLFWYLKDDGALGSDAAEDKKMAEEKKDAEAKAATPPPAKTTSTKKLRLIAPNGGEKWERGKQYSVRWASDLASTVRVKATLFKTDKTISDPYIGVGIAGRDMFAPSTFPAGSNEGSYTYFVPRDLTPGAYQVIVWGGDTCSSVNKAKRCEYDLSDTLLTVR
ncbi:MAG: hypothetical protein EXS68_01480 [Candidatus Ryanbacteria bacterium]|nr:hypothetical protein [Candidatus Ryanbacteria bacterium]